MVPKRERYSYTKLNTYENCPFHFYLKYRLEKYIDTDSCASLYGTLVHYILEREALSIKNHLPINYDKLIEIFTKIGCPKSSKDLKGVDPVESIRKKFPEEWYSQDTKSGKSYEEKAQEFIESGIYDFPKYMEEHPELQIIGPEIQFNYEYRGYIFNGFIDLLMFDHSTNEYVIWDIKTKDHEFTKQELTTPLQFVCYCHSLRMRYGEEIKIKCYYSLPVLGIRQEAGTNGFEKRGFKKIDKLLDGVEAREYAPKPSPLCYWCEFSNTNPNVKDEGKNVCPYYSLWTKENKSFEGRLKWTGLDNYPKQVNKLIRLEELKSKDDDFDDFEI